MISLLNMKTKIIIKRLTYLHHFEKIRILRNINASSMTNNSEEISFFQQVKFAINFFYSKSYIFIALDGKYFLGYVYLSPYGDYYNLSIVVDSSFRRIGVGDALLRYILPKFNLIRSEIFNWNTASINLHLKYGFQFIESYNDKSIYIYNKNPSDAIIA